MSQVGKKIIGILRGGGSHDHDISLKKGGEIFSLIAEKLSHKYKPVDLFVDREGIWHLGGIPIKGGEDLFHGVECVWNTLGPEYSQIFKNLSIPHLGLSPVSLSLSNSREILQEHIKKVGVNLPRHIVLSPYRIDIDKDRTKYVIRKTKEVFEKFGAPWIVRSFTNDPSIGIRVAKTFNELAGAIDEMVERDQSIVVEEVISGKNVQTHALSQFRNEDVYTLPVAGLNSGDKEKIKNLTKDLFSHLHADFYINLHFTIHPKLGIYLTGLNFSPDFSEGSHFQESCESVGAKLEHILEHLIEKMKR